MPDQDPKIAIAHIDGRLQGIEKQLGNIQATMATDEGSKNLRESIELLRSTISEEKVERVAGDTAAKAAISKVSDRLQLVEDRMESRKWQGSWAIVMAGVAVLFSVVKDFIFP